VLLHQGFHTDYYSKISRSCTVPRNGSGTYTAPAGNPVTTGTTIQSSWANTLVNDLGAALTQSVSRDGQAAMTGPLPMGGQDIANAGNITASANISGGAFIPTAATVPTNGMYLSAASTVAFSTNTTLRGTVNATGNWALLAPSSGTTLVLGSVAAGSGLIVNQSGGGAALTVAAAGNTTIAAPTSGTALAITAVSGGGGLSVVGSGAAAALAVSGGNGNTIASGSGVALSVTGVNANAIAAFTGTTGAGYISIFDGQAGTRQWRLGPGQSITGNFDIVDSTAGNLTRLRIDNSGASLFLAPSAGATVTANAIAAGGGQSFLASVGGGGNGNAFVATDSGATVNILLSTLTANFQSTGATTATLGTNKPGPATTPTTWMRVSMNGTQGWIPVWAN
jgi:hypothetical protein